jgi:DNA-binding MarR family transcriptional regulator
MSKARLTPAGVALTAMFLKLFRVNGLLLMTGDRLTSDHGLTSARWQVMSVLADGPLTVSQIARNMGLKRQSVQRLVNVLSQQTLLVLSDNPNHRRARLVQMTGSGRSHYEEISQIQAHWVNGISEGLNVGDLKLAFEQLREIEERLIWELSETQAEGHLK